jgi:hypothetical protein
MMPSCCRRLVLTVAALLALSAPEVFASWAAVAYNPRTGAHGSAHGQATAKRAVSIARGYAGRGAAYIHVKNGYCVIVADRVGRHGRGTGPTYAAAVANALQYCPGGSVRVWAGGF